MAETLQDLWPDDIKVDVLTPIAILRMQEEGLSRRTQGLLRAEVKTVEAGTRVRHTLDLLAPSLNYRERLISAEHDPSLVYPVHVTSDAFRPIPKAESEAVSTSFPDLSNVMSTMASVVVAGTVWSRVASSDDAFTRLVREVLTSSWARSRITSLLARMNESKHQPLSAENGQHPSPAEE